MSRQEFDTVDVLRLEVETDPTGLVNLVQNPSGELGGWGWITTIVGSKVETASLVSDVYPVLYPATYSGDSLPLTDTALRYTGVAGSSWFTTEDTPVAAGQYAAARWNAVDGAPSTGFFRARFEWVNSAGAVISSSAQTGYLGVGSGAGNLGAQLAPAGTVWARLRFDVFATNTGTAPAAAHTLTFAEVTVAKSATSGTLGQSRANLVPNPSFETDIAGWQTSGGTITRTTSQAAVGTASLRHTAIFDESEMFATLAGVAGIPVQGGATYALGCQVRTGASFRSVRLWVRWYDAGGTLIGQTPGPWRTAVSSSWGAMSGTLTAPAGAAFAQLRVTPDGGFVPDGMQFYFDAFYLERADTFTSYFDSSTPDAGGWEYGGTTQAPVVVQTRTNLVPNPAPASASGYAGGNATVTYAGTAIRVATNGNIDSFASVGGDVGGMRLGMVAGRTYTASADLWERASFDPGNWERSDAIVVHHRIGTGAWTVLTTNPAGTAQTIGRKSLSFTLPAGTTEAFVRLYCGRETGYTDWRKVMLEESPSAGAYFDGGTADSTSDFTAYDRAWSGTPDDSTSTETATVTLPYATAVNSNLGYLDPVQYLDVIGESHDLRSVRQALQVGELKATIISRSLDPADSTLIRPGRRARLRTLVSGAWEEIITGKLLEASVNYELKDPSIPDEKRARIDVSLVDAGQPLAQAKRPQGVATIAELPFVLEGAGVPWNVNGSGNQVATATPTTFNDNATALTQLALTRDTRSGYAWVSRRGVVNAWDAASLPSGSPLVLDEATYSDLKVTYGTDDCINACSFTVQTLGVDGTTAETTYGPYEDATSIETYGRYLKEFTVTGLTKPDVDDLAAAILTANKTPARQVQSVTLPLNTLARVNAHALIDLYDEVQVVNGEVSLSDTLRVTGIEHSVELKKWLVTLTFATDGAVASPLFQPPVQSDASPDVGVVELFAGPTSKIPATKLLCDGASKAVADYPYLHAVIGYTYGGSGAFFNVPDLQDRVPIGVNPKALGTGGSLATAGSDGVPWRAVNFVIRAV